MTGSETIRRAARVLYRDASLEQDDDPEVATDVTRAELAQFFATLDRLTNDSRFAKLRQDRYKGALLHNLALQHEADTTLDEVIGWFKE